MTPLFDVGTILLSRRALEMLREAGIHPFILIRRHESGDWGNLDSLEWRLNERAAVHGGESIASQYTLGRGLDVWVVTQASRRSTRIVLAEEC
jgi:hypothetical protein